MRQTLHACTCRTYLLILAATLDFPHWLTSVRSQFVISCPWNMGEEEEVEVEEEEEEEEEEGGGERVEQEYGR